MTLKKLSNQDQEIIRDFLGKEPLANLYLLDLLDRQGVDYWGFSRWMGFFDSQELIALNVDIACLDPQEPCKLSVPVGHSESCIALGAHTKTLGGTEKILSLREASDGFHQGLGSPQFRLRQDQRLFWAETPGLTNSLPLRSAQLEERAILIEYTALMRVEDEGYDPRKRNPELWEKSIDVLIAQKRILVADCADEICFVVEVGTRCAKGAQVGSTYVPSQFRRRGFGSRGMAGIIEALRSQCAIITLLADEANLAAMACHKRAGFQWDAAFRLFDYHSK